MAFLRALFGEAGDANSGTRFDTRSTPMSTSFGRKGVARCWGLRLVRVVPFATKRISRRRPVGAPPVAARLSRRSNAPRDGVVPRTKEGFGSRRRIANQGKSSVRGRTTPAILGQKEI